MLDAQRECKLMQEVKNRYVTQYIESFIKGNCLCLIMEYCFKGDLAEYLGRCRLPGNMLGNDPSILNLNF